MLTKAFRFGRIHFVKHLLSREEVRQLRIDRVKLIAEMARRNVTSIRLAEMSGVSRVTVSALRCGKTCTPETANKIARALGVDVIEIMEEVKQ